MFAFWSSIMLRTGRYQGRPMPKHVVLNVDARHFDCWLKIWGSVVDEVCDPQDAHIFKLRAQQIAKSMEAGIANYRGVSIKSDERYHSNHTFTDMPPEEAVYSFSHLSENELNEKYNFSYSKYQKTE